MKGLSIAVTCVLLVASARPLFGQVGTDPQLEGELQQRKKLDEDLKNLTAKGLIDGLAIDATETLKTLAALDNEASAFSKRIDTLMNDDDGRRLALDDNGFMSVMDLEKNPVVTKEAVDSRTKSISDIKDKLTALQGQANYGEVPPKLLNDNVSDAKQWATNSLSRIRAINGVLDAYIARVPHDKDLKTCITLKARIDAFRLLDADALNRSRLSGANAALPDAEKKMEQAAHDAEIARAQEDSERLLRETKAELERVKIESEMREQKAKDEQDARVSVLQKQLAETEAARTVAAAQNQVTLQKAAQDADLTKKRQQCHDPAVTALIQPFTFKGYFQPKSGRGVEAKPMSLSEIRAVGALTPTAHGLEQLIKCANWSARGALAKDDRPGWGNYLNLQQASNEDVEMVKKAQATLIDLGDALVAEGMLSP